ALDGVTNNIPIVGGSDCA
ncbi:jg12053, partial [Pararge aegeria aegeria]